MVNRGGRQEDINDINVSRNGLLLAKPLHTVFGAGEVEVAFWRVRFIIIAN